MKVLHIISGNDNGGGARHVLNLCINSEDMESTIGCLGTGPLYDQALEAGVPVRVFNTKDFLKQDVLDYIKAQGFDLIDFHGAKAFLLNRLICKRLGIPSAATVHSNYREDFLNSAVKHRLFTPLSIMGLKSFRYFICVSKYIRDILNKDGFKGTKLVVSNGINLKETVIKESRQNVRQALGIGPQDFVYIMVARLHPVKNHNRLIRAFSRLHVEHEDTRLLLVGEGDMLSELKKLPNVGVIFAGFRENPESFINASDISVLSSLSEGGAPPLVILESAAVKKPAAVSRVGDLDEIINESCGYIFNPCSEEDIYLKLREAYENKVKLKDMGEALYSNVSERFSMDKFCSSYFEAYRRIIEEFKGTVR